MWVILFLYPVINICELSAGLKINDQCFQWDSSHICQWPKSWQAPLGLLRKTLQRFMQLSEPGLESRLTDRDIWPWRSFEGPHCVLTLSQPTLISQNPSLLNESGLGTITCAHIAHTITRTYIFCADKTRIGYTWADYDTVGPWAQSCKRPPTPYPYIAARHKTTTKQRQNSYKTTRPVYKRFCVSL